MKSRIQRGAHTGLCATDGQVDVRMLGTGERVTWRGLRCTVREVQAVWIRTNCLSLGTSIYVMQNLSSTFNVSFREFYFG